MLYLGEELDYREAMNDIDLNLLIALDVLLEEESVTAAAARLNLSASAMSRTLKRLRETTGDPLLVRAGRGLVPTPHAIALRQRVHAMARDAREILQPHREVLDIPALERTFTLRTNAAFIERFSVPLVTAIAKAAPKVRLRFAPKPNKAIEPLREARLDLEIGVIETTAPELVTRLLFRDRFVGVARKGHPRMKNDAMTPETFASCAHVMASPSGDFSGPIQASLSALGIDSGVAVVVPGFSDALRIVRHTDLVTLVPRACLDGISDVENSHITGLIGFDLTPTQPPLTISLMWHPRVGADPAHHWFRKLVVATCRAHCPPA